MNTCVVNLVVAVLMAFDRVGWTANRAVPMIYV